MRNSIKPAFAALALTLALAAPALAGQNAPNTSNNAPNPLAVSQSAVGDFDAAGADQVVYDRQGHRLGHATVEAGK